MPETKGLIAALQWAVARTQMYSVSDMTTKTTKATSVAKTRKRQQ